MGRIPAHVLDDRRAAGAKDSVNLGKRCARQREVLERRLADHEVECLGSERHVRNVTVPKFDADAGPVGVLAPDLYESAADVQPCYIETTKTSHLDRQVSGAGRDLQHPGAFR